MQKIERMKQKQNLMVILSLSFPGVSMVEYPNANEEDMGFILSQEDLLEAGNGNPLHFMNTL